MDFSAPRGHRARMSVTALRVVWTLFAAALCTGAALAQAPAAPVPAPTLPTSLTPAPRTDDWAIAREKELLRRAREAEPAKVVFVGDSITQAWEDDGAQVWQRAVAPLGALNLGNSGDRTEHVLWRLQQAPLTRLAPQHVVLLIGTNNLGHGTSNAQDTLAGVKAIVTLLAAQCPAATIHLLEIFPRDEAMSPMRGDICQINQALRAFVRDEPTLQRGTVGHEKRSRVTIHALGDSFVRADGSLPKELMPDGLHLSTKGYELWAAALVPFLTRER